MKWNLASGYVGASWMQALDGSCPVRDRSVCDCDDTGAYSIGLGYYHTMSKQTQVYVVGSWLDNKDQGQLRHGRHQQLGHASRTSARPSGVWASASSTPSNRPQPI